MTRVLAALLLGAAVVLGAALALWPAGRVLLALAALLPLPLILRDFRVGVVLLTLLLPLSTMLPPLRGLNLLNYLTLATLLAFTLRAAFDRRHAVAGLPAPVWWGFVLPVTMGIVVAWPHIPEGVRNYPALADARSIYDPVAYALARWAKPLLYWLGYAFLLANAVRASARPERFIALLAASALLPALVVFATVARYPGTLGELVGDREFMRHRGLHANEFGLLLALACGPLLFVAAGAASRRARLWAAAALAVVFCGVLMTFSRGAMLACLVMLGGFLWQQRRLKTMLGVAAAALLFTVAAPQALQDRLGTGLRAGAISDTARVDRDELTAGRVHGWMLLAPEVLESPWIGRGLGSTQWSSAVAAGRYRADHPHNIYLEVLMDLGLLGFAAVAACYAFFLRRLRQLAAEPSFSPDLRSFFQGARWALWGALAMAATTAYYMPNPAQTYLWFALGLAFAFRSWPARPAGAGASAR
jgi:O-antigen ligase